MTLKELSRQYCQSAEVLHERIDILAKRIETEKMCEMDLLRLRLRIETLRTMYYDTLKTAKTLENYYI